MIKTIAEPTEFKLWADGRPKRFKFKSFPHILADDRILTALATMRKEGDPTEFVVCSFVGKGWLEIGYFCPVVLIP